MALAWAGLIAALTLVPDPGAADRVAGIPVVCVVCGSRGLADVLLNVALFLPLGWGVARWKGTGWALALGFLATLGVEGAQAFLPGRTPVLGDILANTLGAGLGAAVAHGEGRAVGLAVPLSVAAVLAPLVLLVPDPPPGTYFGQWTARFGDMEAYRGRVLAARVGGVAMPSRRSPESPRVREALRRGEPVRVRFEVGPAPTAFAPVFSVFDHRRRGIFFLGVEGPDVVVRRWTRATTLKLDAPELRWAGALGSFQAGDTVEAVFGSRTRVGPGTGTGPCLEVEGAVSCDGGPRADQGWALLLYPVGPPGSTDGGIGLAWLAGLGGILGLGVGGLGSGGERHGPAVLAPGPAAAILGAGILAVGAVAAGRALPHVTAPLAPWAGLVAGAALGAVVRRRMPPPPALREAGP